MQFTSPISGILTVAGTVALAAGTSVGLAPGTTVDASGSTVGITGTPTVSVGNSPTVALSVGTNVGIVGTPNVGIATPVPPSTGSATLAVLNDWANVPLAGQLGAAFSVAAGTLIGTLTALVSVDNGVTYTDALMYDLAKMQPTGTTMTVSTPASPVSRGIVVPPGATHVAVRLTARTSGSVVVTVTASSGFSPPMNSSLPGLLPPTGTPTSTARNTSAASTASATSSVNGTATVVGAPGAAKQLELHQAIISVSIQISGTSGGTVTGTLKRSDNGATLATITGATAGSTTLQADTEQINVDFEGATLPANVGVNFTLTSATGSTSTGSCTLNYTVLS